MAARTRRGLYTSVAAVFGQWRSAIPKSKGASTRRHAPTINSANRSANFQCTNTPRDGNAPRRSRAPGVAGEKTADRITARARIQSGTRKTDTHSYQYQLVLLGNRPKVASFLEAVLGAASECRSARE